MNELLPQLIADVNRVLDAQGHGSRVKLAQWLQVRPQKLNDWLKGHAKPSGEQALKLKAWLDVKPSGDSRDCPLGSISTWLPAETAPKDWTAFLAGWFGEM